MNAEFKTASQTRGNCEVISSVSLAFVEKLMPVMFVPVMFVLMLMGSPTAAYANDSVSLGGLGFNVQAMETTVGAESSDRGRPEDSLHIGPLQALNDSSTTGRLGFIDPSAQPLSAQSPSYQSQGFKVNRISASWKTAAGKLTVGNDWTSFQDLLSVNQGFESANVNSKNHTVVSQVKWLSPNGFSISLEDAPKISSYSTDSRLTKSTESNASPGLILSWQGSPVGVAGAYRVSAIGKKFEIPENGQSLDNNDIIGWGLNLEGGWQMGDLFAALSVTFGKGIDSYILQRFGNDLVVAPNHLDDLDNSLSIQPSLYYRLNNNSNFHVSLGHYASETLFNNSGSNTLDTINMGYGWSPWPSTKFGVGLVNQGTDSQNGLIEESTQVKFDAEKRF